MKSLDSLLLSDIATRRVLGIPGDSPLPLAARRMGETRVSCLVILDGLQPSGIITERDLVKLLHHRPTSDALARDVMRTPVITAPLDLDFRSAYVMLRQHGIRHLVAVDSAGALAGVATATDFRFHLGLDGFREIHDLQAVLDPVTAALPPEAVLAEALERMVREQWDYVLVVKDEKPLGILTERDVPLLLAADVQPSEIQMREVMSTPVQSISLTATLAEASARMAKLRIRHMAVVNESQRLVGMLSQDSLLEKLGIEIFAETWRERTHLRDDDPASEGWLAMVLETTSVGTWEYACLSDRCICSSVAVALLGYPKGWQPENLAAWLELIHPEDRRPVMEILQAAQDPDNPLYETEYRLRRRDGRWLAVRARVRVSTRDSAGRALRVVGTLADISERRQSPHHH